MQNGLCGLKQARFHQEGALGKFLDGLSAFHGTTVHVSEPLKKLWEGRDLKSLKGNGILGLNKNVIRSSYRVF